MSERMPAINRFWNNIEIDFSSGCWNWIGKQNRGGYGRFYVINRLVLAHRYSFEYYTSIKIPPKILCCHTCDNPKCCAPHHLFLGTHQDNNTDCKNKNRKCKFEKHPFAKLTQDIVKSIRSEYIPFDKQHGVRALGRKSNVSRETIRQVLVNKSWVFV